MWLCVQWVLRIIPDGLSRDGRKLQKADLHESRLQAFPKVILSEQCLNRNFKNKSKIGNNNIFPKIFEKGEDVHYIYFILKGEVYFTNESGAFKYYKLQTGSYFGDTSVLFDIPSSYSAL